MSEFHLRNIDLNLLRVFDALAEEGSVTRAGERLGLTQSAVSHALNRLRHVFSDELFIRGSDGMRPTSRAAEIAPSLRDALLQLQSALEPTNFTPSETERRFTIAAGAYVTAVLLPVVVASFRQQAPRAEIRIRALEPDLEEALQTGAADVAIGAFGRLSGRFLREPIAEECSVWVTRAGHPLGDAPLTLERLAQMEHVIVAFSSDQEGDGWTTGRIRRPTIFDDSAVLAQAFEVKGLKRRIGLTVHDSLGALAVAARTDMACLGARRLARLMAEPLDLKLFDPPYPSAPISIETVWSQDRGANPATDWLRALVRQAASEI